MRLGRLCIGLAAATSLLAEPSYYRDIRPILQKNCAGCHQPSSKASGLDLTTFAAFKSGGSRGGAFVAGQPAESLIIKYLTGAMKPVMPLGGAPLPPEQIATVREWITAGARDDTPASDGAISSQPTVYHQPPVITALRFSPDGKTLAVSGNREVLLHNADGSGLIRRMQGQAERILAVDFSRDGSLMIAGGGTPARFGEVQWWDPRSGKELRSAEVTSDTVFGASLAPDASRVVVGATDNTVRILDSKTGKELHKVGSHENWVLATVFGVDGKRFVSVGRDRAAKLMDATQGQFLENVNALKTELGAVARHPQRDVVVIGGEDRYPYVYMMDRPRNLKVGDDATLIRRLERQDGAIFALDWSADGKRIAVAGASPNVTLYDGDSGSRLTTCSGHSAGIYTIAFSPDGAHLATGGFDGTVRIYNAANCSLEKSFIPVPVVPGGGTSAGGGQ